MTFTRSPISAVLTDDRGYVVSASTPIPVNPAESGSANFNTGQVSIINASATLIAAANATRRAILITNTHASLLLYVGSAAVATGTGQQVPPGASIVIPIVGAIYGIGSGSLTASFIEVYD